MEQSEGGGNLNEKPNGKDMVVYRPKCFGCRRLAASSLTRVMCMGTREADGCTPARVTVLSHTTFPDGRTTTQRETLKVKA